MGFRKQQQQVASGVAASALVLAPASANAIVDYDAIKYLGGSDKVDINNGTYRRIASFLECIQRQQVPLLHMGRTVRWLIFMTSLEERVKDILKKYEGQFVCL